MSKTVLSALVVFGMLIVSLAILQADAPDKEASPAAADAVDVTESLRDANSDKFAAPPKEFRAGHVTPRKLDAKAITTTKAGFVVKLPSGAPIPTPTVYEGKVYVSGGFHSKEFYCFDAVSGKLVWGIDLDDDGPSAAVVSDGICVFNTESCTIFAVNALTGSPLWSHWLGDPLTSTPAIAGGRVFTSYPAAGGGGFGGNVQQIAPVQNGEGNQQLQQSAELQTNQQNGDADVADDSGKKRPPMSHVLACLDLKTGKILWQRWIDSDVMSSPVCVDDEVYITTFAGTVMKFEQQSGKILSAKRERATSAPVVVGKDVLFTARADKGEADAAAHESLASVSRDGAKANYNVNRKKAEYLDTKVQGQAEYNLKGKSLDAGNGFASGAPPAANAQAAWGNIGQTTVCNMQAFQGSRALVMGGDNLTCPGNEIVCNDNRTGAVKWRIKLKGDLAKVGGSLAAPPAAAGKFVFVATLEGKVLQVHPSEGKVAKTYDVGSPVRFQPAIEKGRIYVGTQDGRLVCVDTRDASLTGWSAWGGNAAHTGVHAAAAP